MDRIEFIKSLFEMYPESFANVERWLSAYLRKLPEEIDYEELMDDMLENYQNTRYAPGTGFFMPYIHKQLKRQSAQRERERQEAERQEWEAERKRLEEEDDGGYELLSPEQVLGKKKSSKFFTKEELAKFREYVNNEIPTENLKIKFWKEICELIKGEINAGKNKS